MIYNHRFCGKLTGDHGNDDAHVQRWLWRDDSANNFLSGATFTPPAAASSWVLIASVCNNNEANAPRNQQAAQVQLWCGGTLVLTTTVKLTKNTDAMVNYF